MIGKTLEDCLKLIETDLGTGISRNKHLIGSDNTPSQVSNYISFFLDVSDLQIEFLKKYLNLFSFSNLDLFDAQHFVLKKAPDEISPSTKIVRGNKKHYGTKDDVLSSIPSYSLNGSINLEDLLMRGIFDTFNSASLALDVGLDESEDFDNREKALQFATGIYTRFLDFSNTQDEIDIVNRHQALKKRSQGYVSLSEILTDDSFKKKAYEDICKLKELEEKHSDLLYLGYVSNGKILFTNKDYDLASWAFYQALEMEARVNNDLNSENVFSCKFNLSLIQLEKGNYSKSRELLDQERKSSKGLSIHSSIVYLGSYTLETQKRNKLAIYSSEDLDLGFESLEFSLPLMKKLIFQCDNGNDSADAMLIGDLSKSIKSSLDLVYSSLVANGNSRESSVAILRERFEEEHGSWYFGDFTAPVQHPKYAFLIGENLDYFPWSKIVRIKT